MKIKKIWISPILITTVLTFFVLGSGFFYNEVQKELRKKESSVVAKAIGTNLISEIKNVSRALNNLSQVEKINSQNKIDIYNKISKSLMASYPGFFYAINFINSDGVIEKVYPEFGNELALKKNVMARPELKPYLEESLQTKKAAMSHRVKTYQGIHAIIIYEPLFDEKNQFKGWVNAVINIDVWLQDQLTAEGWQEVAIQMHWRNHDVNEDVKTGDTSITRNFSYDFEVLNQTIEMKVGFPKSRLALLHKNLLVILCVMAVLLLSLISYLLFKLSASHHQLTKANGQLSLKSILLNSLAHDVSSPLSSISLIIEQVSQNKNSELSPTQKQRSLRSLHILHEMLESVRSLSRLEMNRVNLKEKVVNLKWAVEQAVEIVKEQADQKQVHLHILSMDENLEVNADEKTLVYNVIPNVLTNAIKFTPAGSTVQISAEMTESHAILRFIDEGSGFTSEEIKKFNHGNGETIKTTVGTQGEVGSGLGLTQVKGFMFLYGGKAVLGQTDKGALFELKFRVNATNFLNKNKRV